MSLSDVLDVGVTMMLVLSPLLLRVCVVWVHICVTRDPSVGGTEGERGRGREGGEEGGRKEKGRREKGGRKEGERREGGREGGRKGREGGKGGREEREGGRKGREGGKRGREWLLNVTYHFLCKHTHLFI